MTNKISRCGNVNIKTNSKKKKPSNSSHSLRKPNTPEN